MMSKTLSRIPAILAAGFVICSISGRVSAKRVQFQECGPERNVIAVNVSGCIVQPCRFATNSSVTFSLLANATQASSSVNHEVRSYINGRAFGLPQPSVNACADGLVQPDCPIRPGQLYRFVQTITIQDSLPTVPTTLQFLIRGDEGVVLACVRIHSLISDPHEF
ncbi:NPC intracellular cholesterol transporter 2 [Galendromus occidentalis]|uniref:NPC intracellular cholesterol transporter 2 n=1 Tax=Galendromus occidentalis TaxID=34638 RepID=A0AAJ6QLW7_9ACAR|nr:NPC intracellular cholesterol transporter 2 [Galendromus occidentalis]